MIEKEFQGVGLIEGLTIWRIEKLRLTRVEKSQFGTFYSGDSYLILNTHGQGKWDIHFWLGSKSTSDEIITAAMKATELDSYLGGDPVQYREVQYHESDLFKSYFPNEIRYLEGGAESGLVQTSKLTKTKKLYMVKGVKNVRIVQVPLLSSSLNKSDIFILEDGLDLYQWCPPKANRSEKIIATKFTRQIRDNEHGGKSKIHLQEDWDSNEGFWGNFDQKATDINESSDVDDKDFRKFFFEKNIDLYRISDSNLEYPTISKVSSAPLKKSMLDSNDCFLIDGGEKGIFTWIGKKCTKNEKKLAILAAKEIIQKRNYPNYIPMSRLIDGAETTAFKDLFSDWN
ncbi:unnamed protein product [Brachionus calyciflorus]|uniref:Gelsolin-like domain-containing protein n=1 Tax=Brachionus calyciflorus TaxID=104777 RepID=A0A814GGN2_9BILA|nr:unnamed protein product [Brachionus calyciflorus]